MPELISKITPLTIKENVLTAEVSAKYAVVNNTFVNAVKEDSAHRISVEIGDIKDPEKFHPQVKVCMWGDSPETNEVNFSMRALEDPEATIQIDGEKIKYIAPKYEVHLYDKPEAGEDGGYEFEWVLNELPATNVLQASIKTKGLDFFYQPALTEEEIAQGMSRPDNVVGSYAVYHSSKRDNIVGGKEYKTGKAFHIYRPEAIDAKGNRTWCDINIDTVTELATVTVPREFLDTAVYPVVVDPTFGYTSQGASDYQLSSAGGDDDAAQKGTSITGGLTSISAYVKRNSANANVQLEIWSDTGTVPNARLDGSADIAVTSTTYSLKTANVSESLSGNYWVSVEGIYGGPGTQTYVAYDTGGGTGATTNDSQVWSADSNRYSVYALVGIDTANYTNCHAITIDHTKVSGAGDLTDFPVLISGTYDGTGSEPDLRVTGSGGQVTSSSGYDIEFSSDSAGTTKLAHELQYYSSTTGQIVAWVKVNTLDGDADTVIYMWFGNSNVTASTASTDVWNSGFAAVHHLDEASGSQLDSTANGKNLETSGSGHTYGTTGKIHKGYTTGGTGGFYNSTSPYWVGDYLLSTGVTLMAWAKMTTAVTNGMIAFHSMKGYHFVRIDSTTPKANVYLSGGSIKTASGSTTISTGTWYHLAFRWVKNDKVYIYVNGAEDGSTAMDANDYLRDEGQKASIGEYSQASQFFNGVIEHVTWHKVDRGADWIATAYNNENSPSTFYSVGTTNLVGGGGGGSTWVPKIIFM